MPQGVRTTSVRTGQPEEISLSIGVPVLEILEHEADAFGAGMARTEFARVLLRNKARVVRAVRARHAKRHRRLKNAEHERARLALVLAPAELGILIELCNVLGLASKSTVMAHLVLDWVGVSPLRAGFPFDVSAKLKKLRSRRRPTPRSTQLTLLQLAPAIHELLAQDTRLLCLRKPKDVLVSILNARIGVGELHRPDHFPKPLALGNVEHPKKQLGVYLPQPQRDLLDEASRRLGGGEISSMASHFILDWMGISPLADDYELQGAPAKRRGRARSGRAGRARRK